MALLNRFSKLNDRGQTGIFTFIVTRSVTRDLHRDATTKDFCFGYHRWAISFQRPSAKMLGVHLLLRNASPNTACVVDFSLTLLNREHFSQNQVYTKKQAKFTITNPMQGVTRWIGLSELVERHFSNETGEFLFELSLSNMTTIFECDIQLSSAILNQYRQMLRSGPTGAPPNNTTAANQTNSAQQTNNSTATRPSSDQKSSSKKRNSASTSSDQQQQLINLHTNQFTFGSFEWSLTIVPFVVSSGQPVAANAPGSSSGQKCSSSSSSLSSAKGNSSIIANDQHEPVCRVYLNRLSGFDSLCRVRYRVILGHHQPGGAQSAEFVDSKQLDQISDCDGRIRGHQFRATNVLKLISPRHGQQQAGGSSSSSALVNASFEQHHQQALAESNSKHQQQQHHHHHHGHHHGHHHHGHHHSHNSNQSQHNQTSNNSAGSVDLRVHIEMFCANTISEAKVPLERKQSEPQVSNCSDRNKQAWCVEADQESGDSVKLKLFFMDLQSVPRNHIRYISWIAYLVGRDSLPVRNAPHSNYYLQDGIDMGTIMDTDVSVEELNKSAKSYLDAGQLTVHIEWVDSLLLFSHLYNNYDALATVQRHQISRELFALQQEFDHLEGKYLQAQQALNRLATSVGPNQQLQSAACGATLHDSDGHISSDNNADTFQNSARSSSKMSTRRATFDDGASSSGCEPTANCSDNNIDLTTETRLNQLGKRLNNAGQQHRAASELSNRTCPSSQQQVELEARSSSSLSLGDNSLGVRNSTRSSMSAGAAKHSAGYSRSNAADSSIDRFGHSDWPNQSHNSADPQARSCSPFQTNRSPPPLSGLSLLDHRTVTPGPAAVTSSRRRLPQPMAIIKSGQQQQQQQLVPGPLGQLAATSYEYLAADTQHAMTTTTTTYNYHKRDPQWPTPTTNGGLDTNGDGCSTIHLVGGDKNRRANSLGAASAIELPAERVAGKLDRLQMLAARTGIVAELTEPSGDANHGRHHHYQRHQQLNAGTNIQGYQQKDGAGGQFVADARASINDHDHDHRHNHNHKVANTLVTGASLSLAPLQMDGNEAEMNDGPLELSETQTQAGRHLQLFGQSQLDRLRATDQDAIAPVDLMIRTRLIGMEAEPEMFAGHPAAARFDERANRMMLMLNSSHPARRSIDQFNSRLERPEPSNGTIRHIDATNRDDGDVTLELRAMKHSSQFALKTSEVDGDFHFRSPRLTSDGLLPNNPGVESSTYLAGGNLQRRSSPDNLYGSAEPCIETNIVDNQLFAIQASRRSSPPLVVGSGWQTASLSSNQFGFDQELSMARLSLHQSSQLETDSNVRQESLAKYLNDL